MQILNYKQRIAHEVSLTFETISYSVKVGKNEEKLLLDNISGYVKPNTFMALMGASGGNLNYSI